jgi:hypothetical protein
MLLKLTIIEFELTFIEESDVTEPVRETIFHFSFDFNFDHFLSVSVEIIYSIRMEDMMLNPSVLMSLYIE